MPVRVKERPERTAQGYRRSRCVDCTKQFDERSSGLLNRDAISERLDRARGAISATNSGGEICLRCP
jgi:hypothetical protein